MYEDIAKIIFNYSINGKIADADFVRKIVEFISQEKELGDYIKRIKIISNDSSSYNFVDGTLKICISNKFCRLKSLFLNNSTFLINLNVALTIFHELDHVMLKKSDVVGEKTIDVLFARMIYEIKKPKALQMIDDEYINLSKSAQNEIDKEIIEILDKILCYSFFHDNAPHERRANINSHLYLSQILDILYDTSLSSATLDKIRLIELKKFIKNCHSGYNNYNNQITNSPSYDYIRKIKLEKELLRINIYDDNPITAYNNALNNYTLQERILYGLPLTVEELKEINIHSNPFHIYEKKINSKKSL